MPRHPDGHHRQLDHEGHHRFAIGTRRFGWHAGTALLAIAAAGAAALVLL